ncbi:MAG: (2Fe-2S)-binding protein [Pseudobdellovibrionaceae bacterium]|nr:(2Fe-2S)-binding protein [Bdellovibrionales bacterium]USN48546.1 MAG: (2Fe-2S)-binding protein [Pseudobdellovibrionaceae bacterium]
MNRSGHNNKKDPIICSCNFVKQSTIEKAITEGCDTLNKIYDETAAGIGPCGGSCRVMLQYMLDTFKTTGQFPENPRIKRRRKPPPRRG